MNKFSGIVFLAAAAMAVGVSSGACSSSSGSPSATPSAAGESCARTADCGSGLVCIADTCVPKGTTPDGGTAMAIGPDGGVVAIADSGTQLSEAAAPPRLGGLGESCVTVADCAVGLSCIPFSPYGGGGVCDLGSYGLTASGKTCSGECNAATDCCELPLNTTVGATSVKNCQDIVSLVLSNDTSACTQSPGPAPASAVGVGCFLYTTYCGTTCANWNCTANQCVFKGACQNSNVELNGCPAVTRTGRALAAPNCDAPTNTCKATPALGTCNADADCDGKGTNDAAGTCRSGNCTCYQQGCYLKCASDLDCRQGYSCNATSKLCTLNPKCSVDADCAASTEVANAKCSAGTCKVPCANDHQCTGSGAIASPYLSSFGGEVCGADGFCNPVGCQGDTDCQNSASNPGGNVVHLFCVTPPTTPATAVVQSSITN
jgi:hypothetical protein